METQDKEQLGPNQDAEQNTGVSASFLISMERKEQTLLFPELNYDPRFYIRARHPLEAEDSVVEATMPTSVSAELLGRKPGTDSQVTLAVKPQGSFIAKCMAQITDYCLTVKDAEGVESVHTYKPDNSGDNYHNRLLYTNILQYEELRERIEGFLDFVAGRGGRTQEDFEALKLEQPQLLSTS